MPRHDDDLQQIARDRLQAVAGRRVAATPDPGGAHSAGPLHHGVVAEPAERAAGRPATSHDRVGADPTEGVAGSAGSGRARRVVVQPSAASTDDRATRWTASPPSPSVPGRRVDGADDAPRADGADGAPAHDTRDVVSRIRAEALASASTAYADTHGHPLHRTAGAAPHRRWYLSLRHAVVAGAAVAVLAAGVVVRAVVSVPDGSEPLTAPMTADARGVTEPGEPGEPGEPAEAGAGAPGVPVLPGGAAADVRGLAAGVSTADGAASEAVGASPGTVGDAPVSQAGAVVVHVVGQVASPGVVRLAAGSRVADALAVAGGPTTGADLSAVNLARVVADGEQIVVPAPGELVPPMPAPPVTGPPGAGSGATAPATGAVVDLNTAGLAQLDALPGIGPVLAQRILDWRAANGPFRRVEELGEVSGIGDALLGRLAPRVRV